MELSKIITPERVRVPLAGTDKKAVITELVQLLADTGALSDRDAALQAVLTREAERTTGIGYGLAIPHGKTDSCRQLAVAVGKPAQPVEFQSYDGRPVTFIVMLISPPDQTGPHIQALAKISRLMNVADFRAAVDRCTTSRELLTAIETFEQADHNPH